MRTFVGVLALVAVTFFCLPTIHADVGPLDDTAEGSPAAPHAVAVEGAPCTGVTVFDKPEGAAHPADGALPPRAMQRRPAPDEHSTAPDPYAGATSADRNPSCERGAVFRRHPDAAAHADQPPEPRRTWPDG